MHTRIASRATALTVAVLLALHRAVDHIGNPTHGPANDATGHGDGGQSTAEYALVLLGVAAIGLAVMSWATKSNAVGRLLDVVFSALFRKVT